MRGVLVYFHLVEETLIREPGKGHSQSRGVRIQTWISLNVDANESLKVPLSILCLSSFEEAGRHTCLHSLTYVLSLSFLLLNIGGRICVRQSVGYVIINDLKTLSKSISNIRLKLWISLNLEEYFTQRIFINFVDNEVWQKNKGGRREDEVRQLYPEPSSVPGTQHVLKECCLKNGQVEGR